MGDQQKELSKTMLTDTTKLATWKNDIWKTIWNVWNEGSKSLDKNQIPVSMDKREKELAKKRGYDK